MEKIVNIIAKLSHDLGEMEEVAKEHFQLQDLTVTQMHYLEVIDTLGNPNITELASAMQITKPSVTVAIDKLIEKDYIHKVQSDADRRNSHLHLTQKGKRINAMHEYAHQRFSELIEEALNPEEIAQMIKILGKLVDKI